MKAGSLRRPDPEGYGGARPPEFGTPSRLRVLLDHFAVIDDQRQSHRVAYPLAELLLLAVCGTIMNCDGCDAISARGEDHRTRPMWSGLRDDLSGADITLRIRQDVLEAAVLRSLESKLMDPGSYEQFCTEYVRHMNDLRRLCQRSAEGQVQRC